MRQITYLLKVIDDRDYNEKKFDASIHGQKLKPRITSLGLTKEERKEADENAQMLFNRLKQDHASRMKDGK